MVLDLLTKIPSVDLIVNIANSALRKLTGPSARGRPASSSPYRFPKVMLSESVGHWKKWRMTGIWNLKGLNNANSILLELHV